MEPSDEIRAIVLGLWEAWTTGDPGHVKRHFSERAEVVAIGTDPNEWWVGPDARRAWTEQIEATGGSVKILGGDPQAYSDGDVGWASDRPKFAMPDGTEVPARFTAVFRKEDGDWKVVQAHGSIGVGNEEALGQESPE